MQSLVEICPSVQEIAFTIRTDRRTHRRTDGQPENIMPPAAIAGGGIKTGYVMCWVVS